MRPFLPNSVGIVITNLQFYPRCYNLAKLNACSVGQRNLNGFLITFYLALCLEGVVFGEMSVIQLSLFFLKLPQDYALVAVLDIDLYSWRIYK